MSESRSEKVQRIRGEHKPFTEELKIRGLRSKGARETFIEEEKRIRLRRVQVI